MEIDRNAIKNKNAQITIFIVIGIIILVATALTFYIIARQRTAALDHSADKSDISTVRNLVTGCIDSTAKMGLQLLGAQGGRIYLPDNFLKAYYSNVSYSYYESENRVFSLINMQKEFDNFMVSALAACVDDFNALKEQGIDAKSIKVSSDTVISVQELIFNIDYELMVDGAVRAEKFKVAVPVELSKIHETVVDIIDKIVADPDWLDITYLSDLGLKASIISHSDDEFVISLSDPKSKVDNADFIYLIALKLNRNNAPILDIPDAFNLRDNVPFTYQVKAADPDGDSIIFSDNHAMFDISDSGLINFVPSVKGEFDVTIAVTDVHDSFNSKAVKFVVR